MATTRGRLHFGLTGAGRVVLRGACFVLLAALIIPAFGVLSVLVSAVLVALVFGFLLRPRIRVSGSPPDRVIAGQAAHLQSPHAPSCFARIDRAGGARGQGRPDWARRNGGTDGDHPAEAARYLPDRPADL